MNDRSASANTGADRPEPVTRNYPSGDPSSHSHGNSRALHRQRLVSVVPSVRMRVRMK